MSMNESVKMETILWRERGELYRACGKKGALIREEQLHYGVLCLCAVSPAG